MLNYVFNAIPNHDVHYALPDPSLVKCNLTLVRLWRNQEEILKLHALGCSARCKLNALHLPEHERHSIPELHTSKMDTDARSCAGTERMESRFGGGREGFGWTAFLGRNPAVGIETGRC